MSRYHVRQGWCTYGLDVPEHDGTFCALPGQGDRDGKVDGMMVRYS